MLTELCWNIQELTNTQQLVQHNTNKHKQQSCNKRENKTVDKFATAALFWSTGYKAGCSVRLHSFIVFRGPENPDPTLDQILLSALRWIHVFLWCHFIFSNLFRIEVQLIMMLVFHCLKIITKPMGKKSKSPRPLPTQHHENFQSFRRLFSFSIFINE